MDHALVDLCDLAIEFGPRLRRFARCVPPMRPWPTMGARAVLQAAHGVPGCRIVSADARPNWAERRSRASLTGTQWSG
jgi:hypothetical protein